MPAEAEHLAAAQENRAIGLGLLDAGHSGWAAVLFFYSGLHLVDAYLARAGFHPASHESRRGYVARLADLRQLYPDYRVIETRSQNTRYHLRPPGPDATRRLLDDNLSLIEAVIQRLLSRT